MLQTAMPNASAGGGPRPGETVEAIALLNEALALLDRIGLHLPAALVASALDVLGGAAAEG
jgi:hypothetical protein